MTFPPVPLGLISWLKLTPSLLLLLRFLVLVCSSSVSPAHLPALTLFTSPSQPDPGSQSTQSRQTPRCAAVSAQWQRQQQHEQQQPKYSSSTSPTVTPQHPGSRRLLSGALLRFVDGEHIYEPQQRDLWSPWLFLCSSLCPFPMTFQRRPTTSA